MIRASTEVRKRCVELGLLLSAVALAGCLQFGSAPPQPSSSSETIAASPSPDLVTKNYVALVHNYWIQYKTAEGDLDHISGTSNAPFGTQDAAQACFGLASPTLPQDVALVNPQTCGKLSMAMVAVHEKFLSDLNATPVPPQFAAADHAFRTQLPKAIADVNAMISASATGSKQDVLDATAAYVSTMIPIVTDALNLVDPEVLHN
jgi:hypothetical protein